MSDTIDGVQSTSPDEPVDASETTDVTGSGAIEESTRRYVRSPEDVLRLVVALAVAVLIAALTVLAEDSVLAFEEDVIEAFDFLSSSAVRVLHGSVEVIAGLITIVLYTVPFITRRRRLFGYVLLAGAATFVVMTGVDELFDRQASSVLANRLADRAGVEHSTFSGVVGLAQLSAQFIVIRPFVGRRWRNAGLITLALMVLLELLVTTSLPADLFVGLPIGAAIGSLILLAFGRPDRHPTRRAIAAALENAGLPVSTVLPAAVDARGSTPYFATLADGSGLFVKVLGAQERAADLLFRAYRFLRLKNVGDDREFSSLRRTVEHEALIALMARDVGIRTPRLRGVVEVGADSMLLAYEMIDGRSLDGLDDDELTDELMRATWAHVAELRSHRIAHRDLRRANVFVDADGSPWIIDFGFSEVAVADEILDADVAQLLASLAPAVGAERAVSAAVSELGPEVVGAALPRLQAKALSGATQSALKEQPGLLRDLQDRVAEACGVDEVEYAQIDRVNKKTLLLVVVLVAATYFLLPQLGDLPGIIDQVEEANWWWAPVILVFAAMTYVAAAIGMAGAVPERLPPGPLVAASVGSSFASKLAPAGLGGMALYVRFLQKQGVDEPVAVSGVGLNTLAGFIGHISLVPVFLIWAGRDAFGSVELPNPEWALLALGAAVVLALLGSAIGPVRRLFTRRLLPVLQRAGSGMGNVLRRPGKLGMLLGGSMLLTFCNILALYFSVEAFGGGIAVASVGAVYLVGAAIAQVAPTPGGLGAVEAALIAGLVAAGLGNTVAVPAVFLYRLFTFWAPILPGWVSFHWLQRNDYL